MMTPEEFWNVLHSAPEPRPVFYRLYHDVTGVPLFYAMEDLPGTYIEIDQDTHTRIASASAQWTTGRVDLGNHTKAHTQWGRYTVRSQ